MSSKTGDKSQKGQLKPKDKPTASGTKGDATPTKDKKKDKGKDTENAKGDPSGSGSARKPTLPA
jgi:hypothetical protein